MPAADAALQQRLSTLETQLSALLQEQSERQERQEHAEAQKAKELFAQQLKAAQGVGIPVPSAASSQGSNPTSGRQSSHAAASPQGPAVARTFAGPDTPGGDVIDGSGLLPSNNNFPSRYGAGGPALKPARDRMPGPRAGPADGGHDGSAHGAGAGDDFMNTHKYGSATPSDLKFAEQRKVGPRQGFM
jgi:hypothetical protein